MDPVDTTRSANGFEDVISAAVDRQVSEQRALRDELNQIHTTLDELRALVGNGPASAGSAGDGTELIATIRELSSGLRARLDSLEERISAAPASTGGSEVRELAERLVGPLQALPEAVGSDVRSAIEPLSERLTEETGRHGELVGDLLSAVDSLRESLPEAMVRGPVEALQVTVATASEDVQALAHAVLDLNAGLRDWSRSLEDRLDDMTRQVLDGLTELAESHRRSLDSTVDGMVASFGKLRDNLTKVVREAAGTLGSRLDGVEEQLVEAGELSGYMRDQTEDLDKILSSLGDVPQRLEGAVAQALRRALTVRAGLIAEAEKALDRTFTPVSHKLDELIGSLESVSESVAEETVTDELRRVALRQVELDSRLEDLHESMTGQLEELAELIQSNASSPRERPEASAPAKTSAKRRSEVSKRKPRKTSASTKTRKSKRAKAATSPASKSSGKKDSKKTKKTTPAKKTASKTSASGSGRTRKRKAAGKTRTRDFIPV